MVFKWIKLEEYDFETERSMWGIDCSKFKHEMNMYIILYEIIKLFIML